MKQTQRGSKGSSAEGAFSVTGLVKAVITGFILTFLFFVVFAILLTFTSFPERMIPTVVTICSAASVLIAGSGAAASFRSRGWLHGAVIGLIYMVILYLISGISYSNFSVNGIILMMALIVILAGSLGGIIGVNLRSRRKYR